MFSDRPKIEVTSTVELPPAVIDAIATKAPDDVDSVTVRDYCFDHLDRRTQFVTPDGQPVATAVRQR